MQHNTQPLPQPPADLLTWLLWVVLTVVGGVAGKGLHIFFLSLIPSNDDLLAAGVSVLFYLALPLFFASFGQWLLLRDFVVRSRLWVWAALLGIFFMYPYLVFYSFSALRGNGDLNGEQLVFTFGTPAFWHAISVLAALSCAFGGLIGLFQGMLIIRRYSTKSGRVLCWMVANAIAWGIGFPLGAQGMPGFLWQMRFGDWPLLFGYELPPTLWTDKLLKALATWLIIGIVTGAVFIWLANAEKRMPQGPH